MSDYVSSSSASSSRAWKYEVFLSFRGVDTRRNFVSHLYNALQEKGIHVFKDDERLEAGKTISNELLKAIQESRSAIVIFSKRYASSRWCLEELEHIIKCKNELDLNVVPLFYDVNPSDVRHQNSPFAESFFKHEKRCKDGTEKVQRWRDAFVEAGKLSGYHLQNFKDEADCIKKLVDDILPKSLKVISPFPENFVGTQIEKVMSLLNLDSNHDVRSIGIWGMGGIGKTEIASCLHQRYRHRFDADCFLGDVEALYQRNGLTWLAQALIRKLLGEKITLTSEQEGVIIIKNMLRHKKVLLILDNVSHQEQLECLAGDPKWFGMGSRIIVTARDKQLLISHVGDNVYEVQLLSAEEALELFSRYAFKEKSPKEDFMELSRQVVQYAGRLPLALKVLGSFFYGRDKEQYRHIIDRLMKIPHNDILAKLRISFDGLEKDVKEMFLDMACLYKDNCKDYVELVLQSRGIKWIVLDFLVEKSLLSINRDSFRMHNLISEMGEYILREEYTHSRIWLNEEVRDLFAGNLKTSKVENLWIQESYKFEDDPANISKVFKRMRSLQVLRIDSGTFCLNCTITHLPSSLRFIHWWGYPSSSLPEKFEPSQLVVLKLHDTQLVELCPIPKKLSNLKHLNLCNNPQLTKTPDFGDIPNLEKLDLSGCENLEEVHPSLGNCRMLTELNFWGCTKLKKLPKFVTMLSLKILYLHGCTSLKKFPKICGAMERLSTLNVGSPWIRSLPPSLSGLTELRLTNCDVLESIPDTIVQNLNDLEIEGCNKLAMLPQPLGVQNKLGTLNIRDCENLKKLPNSIQMESLETLQVCGCPKLDTFPEINGDMHRLRQLSLQYTGIRELPSSIGNLSGLTDLDLYGCENLVSLPNSLCNLKNLLKLCLRHCKMLEKLPESIGNLSGLTCLDLFGCEDFISLPNSICNLKNLEDLILYSCKKLEKLPENIGDLQQLKVLQAQETAISRLPPSYVKLRKLELLDFSGLELRQVSSLSSLTLLRRNNCNIMRGLLGDLVCLSSLKHLELCNSNIMGGLPEDIGSLHSLELLDVSGSNISCLPKSISKLLHLRDLNVQFCKSLSELPEELSPNLVKLYADDHLALNSIRDLLIKCVKLEQISFSESIEGKLAPTNQNLLKFLGHFLRTFIQCHFHQREYFHFSFPIGGRIPESSGCEFSINLNPSWYTDNFNGFLICFRGNKRVEYDLLALSCKLSDPGRKHTLDYNILAYMFPRASSFLSITYIPYKTFWLASHYKETKNPNDYCLFEVSTSAIATCWRVYLDYENKGGRWRRMQRATRSPGLFSIQQQDNTVTSEIGFSRAFVQLEPSYSSSHLQAYHEHNTATDMVHHLGYEIEALEVDHSAMAVQKEHETQNVELIRVCDGPSRKMGDSSRKRKRKRSNKRKNIIKEAST